MDCSSDQNVVRRVDVESLTLNHVLPVVHTVIVDELCVLRKQSTGDDDRVGCVIAHQNGRVVRTAETRTAFGNNLTLGITEAANVVETISDGRGPTPVVVVVDGEDGLVTSLVDTVAALGDGVGDVVGGNADVGEVVVEPAGVGALDGVVDVVVVALECHDGAALFEDAVPLEGGHGKVADVRHGGRSGGANNSSAEGKECGCKHFASVFDCS